MWMIGVALGLIVLMLFKVYAALDTINANMCTLINQGAERHHQMERAIDLLNKISMRQKGVHI